MQVWRNGRRKGLKIPRGQLHEGSTPSTCTRTKKVEKGTFFFLLEFVSGENGRKSEGNRVCVHPPRRDSRTASEALLTAERPPPPAPEKNNPDR